MRIRAAIPDLTPLFVEAAAAITLGIAALAAWAGGWRAELFGLSLSVRALSRPLVIAGALLVLRWSLISEPRTRFVEFFDAVARIAAGALLVAGLLGWTAYSSPYLGGADSYGYVSAAERLRAGTLIQPEAISQLLPYPDAIRAATPLGYVPAARVPGASVPAYPLGLPALMALAASGAGPRAPFYVPLAMGVVLVGACGWLTYRWTRDAAIALMASAAVAFYPVVFAYAIQPMSDVPATACYLVAAACLMSPRSGVAGAAGLAGAAAFWIRPALLPGVAALVLVALVTGERRWHRAAIFTAVLAAAVSAQGWLHWYLYGHPLANGYGPAAELFSLRHLPVNARSYGYWAWQVSAPVVIGLGVGAAKLHEPSARALLAATLIGAVLPYSVYRPYDHWETLRFLLPLLVMATLLTVIGFIRHAQDETDYRSGRWIGSAMSALFIAAMVSWLDEQHVFDLARVEERFPLSAALIERVTPDNAVVLTSLHSGSVRYYARRQTIDWAQIPPGQFDPTVAALKGRGLPVFVMFDGQEEQSQFELRHGRVIDEGGWLPAGQRRDTRLYESPP